MSHLEQLLRQVTPARLSLDSVGASASTAELLRFEADHALARDAVRCPFSVETICQEISLVGSRPCVVHSQAHNLHTHLRRPDLGRRALEEDVVALPASPGGLVVVSDGLSSGATERYAPRVLRAMGWKGIVAVVPFGRVAIGDRIGEAVGAEYVLLLLGERPGLSAPESLGAYLTFGPRVGRTDAERECLSNIRDEGTSPEEAALRIAEMICAARVRGATGVLSLTRAQS